MRLLLDTNILIQLLKPTAEGLADPETGELIERLVDRAAALEAEVDQTGAVLVIPAPVLAEFLLGIENDSIQDYLDMINGASCFEIADFDTAAAIECAQLPSRQELKQLAPGEQASKLKYDRQIVSIALAAMVDEVWSHDVSLRKIAVSKGLTVKSLADMTPSSIQLELPS